MAQSQPINIDAELLNLPEPQLCTSAPTPPSAQVQASTPPPAQVQAPTPPPAQDQAPTPSPAQDQAPTPSPAQVRVAAPAVPAPNRTPEHLMHKNRLQEYCQRSSITLPVYQTVNEGYQHAPKFRSTVLVDGEIYTSPNTFSHRRVAEQDVAKLALECISKKIKDEGCPLINKDTVFCKSILNEFAVKMNLEMPTYKTVQSEALLPVFVSSLVFGGIAYPGETGRSKKEAEQLAARAVIRTLLGTSGYATVLSEIIKSKTKLYAALNKVQDSKYSTQNISTSNVLPAAISEARVGMHPTTANFQPSTGMHPLPATPGVSSGMHSTAEVSAGIATSVCMSELGAGMHTTIAIPRVSIGVHPTAADAEASTRMNLPYHQQFVMPKLEPSSETINLPISFVPPGLGQPSVVGKNSTNKRSKNKRKANKKLRTDAQLCTRPLAQGPPCSVAQ